MPGKRGSRGSERCSVCAHEKCGQIDYALAKGISLRAVADEHGLGPTSVFRHFRDHVPETYKQIIGSGVYRDLDELLKSCGKGDAESLDVLNAMISGFFHQWALAFSNGAQSAMVQFGSQLRQLIELRAKITRELAPAQHLHQTVNTVAVMNDISGLLKILRPFPDACRALVEHFDAELKPRQIEHVAAD
jgi:AcrR family transcriptional regulator